MNKVENINFQWVSAQEYSDLTKLPYASVLAACKTGRLEATGTGEKGSTWYVKLYPADVVSKEQHEEILKENAALKENLRGILRMLPKKLLEEAR